MNDLYPKIKLAASTTRNPELRSKLLCLLRGLKEGDIARVCEPFGVSRRTWYRWLDRLMEGRFDPQSLLPRSSRPLHHPRQIEGELKEKILEMREEFRYGPRRIAWYLCEWGFSVSATGVYKVLKRAGVKMGKHRTKKKNPHTKRYELDRPGEGFQLDIKYVPFLIEKKKSYVFSAIDDCSRWRFSYAYRHLGVESALDFVRRLIEACPFSIESIQTDNGIEFTNRFSQKSTDYDLEHAFPMLLRTLKILHKLIPPGIKELNGKVERGFKTDMDEFFWRIPKKISFQQFQKELHRWTHAYNHQRPHSSLKMRPLIQRLSDFGFQPRTTQKAYAQFQNRSHLPLPLTLALKLEESGRDSSYFRSKLPKSKKKHLSIESLTTFLAAPPAPVCHMCGISTGPYESAGYSEPFWVVIDAKDISKHVADFTE